MFHGVKGKKTSREKVFLAFGYSFSQKIHYGVLLCSLLLCLFNDLKLQT